MDRYGIALNKEPVLALPETKPEVEVFFCKTPCYYNSYKYECNYQGYPCSAWSKGMKD